MQWSLSIYNFDHLISLKKSSLLTEGDSGTETKTQRGKNKKKASPSQKKGKVRRLAELEKMDAWQQLRLFQGRQSVMEMAITHVGHCRICPLFLVPPSQQCTIYTAP